MFQGLNGGSHMGASNYIQPPSLFEGIPQILNQYGGYLERQNDRAAAETRYMDAITRSDARDAQRQDNANRSFDLEQSSSEFNKRMAEDQNKRAQENHDQKQWEFVQTKILPALSHAGATITSKLLEEATTYGQVRTENNDPVKMAELMKDSFRQMKTEAQGYGLSPEDADKIFGKSFDYNRIKSLSSQFDNLLKDEKFSAIAAGKLVQGKDFYSILYPDRETGTFKSQKTDVATRPEKPVKPQVVKGVDGDGNPAYFTVDANGDSSKIDGFSPMPEKPKGGISETTRTNRDKTDADTMAARKLIAGKKGLELALVDEKTKNLAAKTTYAESRVDSGDSGDGSDSETGTPEPTMTEEVRSIIAQAKQAVAKDRKNPNAVRARLIQMKIDPSLAGL
jgi:hypothetical protein